jgi:hypothetical protein
MNNIEDNLQQDCFIWFNNTYCLKHHIPRFCIFSVPNGGLRTKTEAKRLKQTGLRAGVSDLIIVLDEIVLFMELKTETGTQSDEQIEFENIVTNLNHKYYLVRTLDQFKQIIINEINTYTNTLSRR